jgi:hypothetical protein
MDRKKWTIVERPCGEGELKKATEIIARVSYSMEVSKQAIIRDDLDGHNETPVGGQRFNNGRIKFIEKYKTVEPNEDYTLLLADRREIDISIADVNIPRNYYQFIVKDGWK